MAINILLDTCALVRRKDKCKLKFKSKPGIILSLQNSISIKDIFFLYVLSKQISCMLYYFVLLFLVTQCLVVVVQPCME